MKTSFDLNAKFSSVNFIILFFIIFPENLIASTYYSVAIVIVAIILFIFSKWSRTTLRSFYLYSWPLLILLVIGVVRGVNNDVLDYNRDIANIMSLLSIFLVGSWFAQRNFRFNDLLYYFIFMGVLNSVFILYPFLIDPYLFFSPLSVIKAQIPSPADVTVWSLVIILMSHHYHLVRLPKSMLRTRIITLILIAALMASLSRIAFFTFVSLLIILNGLMIRLNYKKINIIILLILIVAITFFAGQQQEEFGFFYKISRIWTEIVPSNYHDYEDISYNWRGYESYRGLTAFLAGDNLSILIGQGFGAKVYLGLEIELAGTNYEDVSIIHNGYIYLLLKTGVVGLILFAVFILRLLILGLRKVKSHLSEDVELGLFLMASVFLHATNTFVASGVGAGANHLYYFIFGYACTLFSIRKKAIVSRILIPDSNCTSNECRI